jgi:hypothetical protein
LTNWGTHSSSLSLMTKSTCCMSNSRPVVRSARTKKTPGKALASVLGGRWGKAMVNARAQRRTEWVAKDFACSCVARLSCVVERDVFCLPARNSDAPLWQRFASQLVRGRRKGLRLCGKGTRARPTRARISFLRASRGHVRLSGSAIEMDSQVGQVVRARRRPWSARRSSLLPWRVAGREGRKSQAPRRDAH